jgi:tetratricopeptide (TPR) repeat protein
MAEVKHTAKKEETPVAVERAQDFWSQYKKPILIGAGALILLVGGWFGYKEFVVKPNNTKANEAMFKAEEYLRADSLRLAVNGDGRNLGLAKVADKYGNTKAGNRAKLLAGAAYLRLEDYKNAEKYLKDAEVDSKLAQARAYKLLADAYAGQGKNKEALNYYKKAGHHFEGDDTYSPEYLFLAAQMAHKVLNDNKEAIELYKEIKKKYSNSGPGFEADKYLAQLGVYSAE